MKEDKTLWVIDFAKNLPEAQSLSKPEFKLLVPEEENFAFFKREVIKDHKPDLFQSAQAELASYEDWDGLDEATQQFLERMSLFFKEVIETSAAPLQDKEDAENKLNNLTKSLEELQKWLEENPESEDFFEDEDDLDGKDPT